MQTSLLLFRKSLTGLLAASLVLATACQPVMDPLTPQPEQADNSPAVRAYIRSLGCPDSLIYDAGDHFLADGDLLFDKNMALTANGAQEEQVIQSYDQLIYNGAAQTSIDVSVDAAAKKADPSIAAYVKGAVDLLNYVASTNQVRLKFYTEQPNARVHIKVVVDDVRIPIKSIGQYITGTPPSQGKPGGLVSIHKFYFNNLNFFERVSYMYHALGHCLGLVHTDWKNFTNELPAIQIPGTPASDVNSIMNRNGGALAVSNADKAALRVMYPATAYGFKLSSAYEAFSNSSPVLLTWRGPLHNVKGFDVAYSALGNPTGDGVYAPITFKAGNVSYSRILFRFKRPANVDPNAYKPQVRTYRVRVRTRYSDGSVGNWSPSPMATWCSPRTWRCQARPT
ncbi:M57 family metalloprotease [Spirosoma sp. 209]|uniref:M57 family metalloprotease n=1 Tax=Spirosoma sp. 209 TaxID=1955701 RepID=UPI0013747936|nr:M57 family metalloprotease [Spirosoma sp. 209]